MLVGFKLEVIFFNKLEEFKSPGPDTGMVLQTTMLHCKTTLAWGYEMYFGMNHAPGAGLIT